ncbi:unnamed protein product [Aspergillus oryzae var. brunneus]|uniref:Unnamed protein product n=2 Tax=Aspergillus oryzae TaxID=5062 RepID=A0AAN4YFJ3_ASPOZ|nr:unnamed protein product [Aspergillus oryzae]GMG53426.1 unnamed protein product [Aspergillus oryzae var. brunneus]
MYLLQYRAGAKLRPPRSVIVAKHESLPNPEGDSNLHLDETFIMGIFSDLALSTDNKVGIVLATLELTWLPVYFSGRDAVPVGGKEEHPEQVHLRSLDLTTSCEQPRMSTCFAVLHGVNLHCNEPRAHKRRAALEEMSE